MQFARSRASYKGILDEHGHSKSRLVTDGSRVYKGARFAKHRAVDHNKTAVTDGAFLIFKRGTVGTYQHCGEQHLQRYLAEFDFRLNHRINLAMAPTRP